MVLAHLTENERIIFPDSLSCLAYHESTNFCEILQLFLAIFTLNCATDTIAQNYIDLTRLSYTNTPLNNFENDVDKTNVDELSFKLNVPFKLNDKTTFLTGFSLNKTQLKLDSNFSNTSLYSIGLDIGIYQIYSKKWAGTYLLLPKISSDLGTITREDFQFGLLSLFTNTKRDNLKYKYGLYVNSEKYGTLIILLIGLYYISPTKKFESNILLPAQFDINYQLFTKAVIGMNFDGLSSTYNLNNSMYSAKGEYVAKSSNELFAYLGFHLTNSLYLKTKVGYLFSRTFKVYNSNDKINLALSSLYFGDNRTQLNQNFDTGSVFKLELIYRVHF
ncbi:DUF6268 family outer membrane beta-barrel protein, partial [Lutibacter sp.]|uniref:DUF6268 family outer membrane beta-barrel protein n=1 Tax=Lutibacter sp. TaxID=1925666 RepID=UPI002736AE30